MTHKRYLHIALFMPIAFALQTAHAQSNSIYKDIIKEIDARRIQATIRTIAQQTRLGGPDNTIEEFILGEAGLGLVGRVSKEEFYITIPDPRAIATIEVDGASLHAYPLWPNGVRTSSCDAMGKLIYVNSGELRHFDGMDVRGCIVAMDFNSGQNWRIAARLGASAVLFLEPESTHRSETETKWSDLPLDFPRFWVPRQYVGQLLSAVGRSARVRCEQKWIDKRVANYYAILPGRDPRLRNEIVLVSAYCDSVCVVPALSYGADQASGVAALLELARLLKSRGTNRSVMFLLTSGHFQAMQGMRQFIERRLQDNWAITGGRTPVFAFCLDLSSNHTGFAAAAFGWWFDYRRENVERERGVARAMREAMPPIAAALRMPELDLFADAIGNPDGRHWKNHVPGRFALEAEICNIAGLNALTLITSEDARNYQDTPFDLASHVNPANIATQTRTIACLLHNLANNTSDESARGVIPIPYRGGSSMSRMSLTGGFCTVSGKVLTYDPKKSFLPDTPVANSLAVVLNQFSTYLGVRGATLARARGRDARYTIYGLPAVTCFYPNRRMPIAVAAYKIADSGEIEYAVDYSVQDDQDFSSYFLMSTVYRETPVVVFRCNQIDIYGLIDPQNLKAIKNIELLDARNDGPPRQGSYIIQYTDIRFQGYTDDAMVMFVLPDMRIKVIGGHGPGDVRIALTNATSAEPTGRGFSYAELGGTTDGEVPCIFTKVALRAANDLYRVNQWRLDKLRSHNIVNIGIERLQRECAIELTRAEQAYEALNYSEAERHARAAWGLALRAHPKILGETKDVLNGLVFYLGLLLPFSYFAERLLFAYKRLAHQLLASMGIFVLTFVALRALHPAFDLTGQTFIIFVAFTMGALSLIVMTFVTGKFEAGLLKLQRIAEGAHEERVGKIGIALTALNIALSSMKRRRTRTGLTIATLFMVTFIVLSFASVITHLRFNRVDAPGTPLYSGMLLRGPSLEPLEQAAYNSLVTEFGDSAHIGRRAWFFGAEIGQQSVLTVRHENRRFDATALVGLDPEEAVITRPNSALLAGGRWFTGSDEYVMILPLSVAERLKVSTEDVSKATVSFGGAYYTVIGIVDDVKLKAILDLDDESILPADFSQSRQLFEQGRAGEFAYRKFIRIDPSTVVLVPARTAINLGADMRSIAVAFDTQAKADEAMMSLMPRLGLNIYASVSGEAGAEIKRFSTVAASTSRGLELVVMPLFIAAIIVLNTMIASVMERKREIGIFSSVGLSPNHIAALFFAESLVYAIMGSVLGFFVAQIFVTFGQRAGILPGVYLNYGSMSAVVSTCLVVFVVMVSTLYPARIARRIASPGTSEDWKLRDPQGDDWSVVLPFTVSRAHARALSKFYSEWLAGFQEYTIGDIVTQDVSHGSYQEDGRDVYFARATCWLAPYDLGVQQEFRLVFRPTDIPDIYGVRIDLRRISGDPEHWQTLNRRFFQSLRRQFLIWRTLSAEEKERYLAHVPA